MLRQAQREMRKEIKHEVNTRHAVAQMEAYRRASEARRAQQEGTALARQISKQRAADARRAQEEATTRGDDEEAKLAGAVAAAALANAEAHAEQVEGTETALDGVDGLHEGVHEGAAQAPPPAPSLDQRLRLTSPSGGPYAEDDFEEDDSEGGLSEPLHEQAGGEYNGGHGSGRGKEDDAPLMLPSPARGGRYGSFGSFGQGASGSEESPLGSSPLHPSPPPSLPASSSLPQRPLRTPSVMILIEYQTIADDQGSHRKSGFSLSHDPDLYNSYFARIAEAIGSAIHPPTNAERPSDAPSVPAIVRRAPEVRNEVFDPWVQTACTRHATLTPALFRDHPARMPCCTALTMATTAPMVKATVIPPPLQLLRPSHSHLIKPCVRHRPALAAQGRDARGRPHRHRRPLATRQPLLHGHTCGHQE